MVDKLTRALNIIMQPNMFARLHNEEVMAACQPSQEVLTKLYIMNLLGCICYGRIYLKCSMVTLLLKWVSLARHINGLMNNICLTETLHIN